MRRNRIVRSTVGSIGAVILGAVALAACGSSSPSSGGTTSSTTTTSTPTSSSTGTTGSGNKFLACEVTDTGGINDRSFNASAYQGLKDAAAQNPNITYTFLSSTSTSDYAPNISALLSRHCGIIITVGFDMGDATSKAAKANPSQKFAIVDFAYSPNIPNVLGLTYNTNESAFLGGYIAAAMTKTNAVGTFGGQNIPPVTIYMDGFVAGVRYYDQQNHKSVKALGWNPTSVGDRSKGNFTGSGTFTNDFVNQGLGKQDTQALLSQGAGVIFPVAGSVGLGAVAAVKAANSSGASDLMEWVDVDGCVSAPDDCSLFITSVEKGIAVSVKDAVLAAAGGTFQGGIYTGDLKNQGVGIAPFHTFQGKIPASVVSALPTITAGIEGGTISVDPNKYPAP